MRILLDHCVARPFKLEFPTHDVRTAREMGWEALKNGDLLDKAHEAGFDVLLTVDQNLRYQQNLTGRAIAVIVMAADGITVDDLRPLAPLIEQALLTIQPGTVYEVSPAANPGNSSP